MSEQNKVRLNLISGWVVTVLEVVKNVDLPIICLCSNNLVSLRHVPCSVHFTKMIDLNFDLNTLIFGYWNCAKSRVCLASYCCRCIDLDCFCKGGFTIHNIVQSLSVIPSVLWGLQRNLHLDNLQIVLLIIRGMSTNQKTLDCPVRVVWCITIRHPLNSEWWPCECMSIQSVVEKGCMLLPYLVLLEDALLLQLIGIVHYMKKLG